MYRLTSCEGKGKGKGKGLLKHCKVVEGGWEERGGELL